jgi:hypothetical protein
LIDLNDVTPLRRGRIDLDAVVAALRHDAPRWVTKLFPAGRREGEEWRLANIRGDAPRKHGSCVITLTGERAGEWFDFDRNHGGGVLSTIEQATGLAGRELLEYAADLAGLGAIRCHPSGAVAKGPASTSQAAKARDDTHEIELILARSVPAAGTLVDVYLASRGLPPPACPDLFFHPDLTHWDSRSGWPAMVAVVRNSVGSPIGLHRTWLAPDGKAKAPVAKPRKMLGKVAGGSVRLAPPTSDGLLGLAGVRGGWADAWKSWL